MLTRVAVAFDSRLVGEVVDTGALPNGGALVSASYLRPLAHGDAPVQCSCGRSWLTEDFRAQHGHDGCAAPPEPTRRARRAAAAA